MLAYTVAVVLWGALVRATLSGDGCGDHWPLCNGLVVPVEPSRKTLIELTHRITSGLCWIWTFGMWLASRRLFARAHPSRRAAGWSLFFMSTEALVAYARNNQKWVEGKQARSMKILYQDERIAVVHAVSDDFYDLCSLAKVGGKWKIVQVLWARNPEEK